MINQKPWKATRKVTMSSSKSEIKSQIGIIPVKKQEKERSHMISCIHGTLDQGGLLLKSNHLAWLLRSLLSECHATLPFLSGAAEEIIIWPLPWIHNPELKVVIFFLETFDVILFIYFSY